jgi:hypothetical protein
VATARQLPPHKPAESPLTDRSARWPVLARIAEVGREGEQIATSEPPSTQPTYRLDTPHKATPAPVPQARPLQRSGEQPQPQPAAPAPAPALATPITEQKSATPRLPLPIRAAVEAWQVCQPHHELIRFTAMLVLMTAAGMSAVLMMRDRLQNNTDASAPVAANAGQSNNPEPTVQHAELEPALEPELAPDTDTSSIEPTATGPLTPPAKPLMAVESSTPPVAPYPTTAFAEATLPPLEAGQLPQVRTTDPEVAHLRGDVIETQVR